MSSDSTVLGSASLGGSLYEPSALFEDWKRTLVFQYDFVKVLVTYWGNAHKLFADPH